MSKYSFDTIRVSKETYASIRKNEKYKGRQIIGSTRSPYGFYLILEKKENSNGNNRR